MEEDLVIPHPQKSIRAGAIAPFSTPKFGSYLKDFIKVAAQEKIPIDIPYSELDKEAKRIIWKGQGEYSGIDGFFEDVRSQFYKVQIGRASCRDRVRDV